MIREGLWSLVKAVDEEIHAYRTDDREIGLKVLRSAIQEGADRVCYQ
jgi:hypothetical protein